MEIQKEDLVDLIDSVWSSLIGLDIVERPDGDRPQDEDPAIRSTVAIADGGACSVAVTCDEAVAQQIAAAMFRVESAGDDEVCDCLGELANVIGGNVKAASLLSGDVSLPTVEFGTWADFAETGAQRVWMDCEGAAIAVSVRAPAGAGIADDGGAE